jgi:hypothetical protein
MYYKEFLRVRGIALWFAIALAAIALLVLVSSGHGHVHVDLVQPAQAATHHVGPVKSTPSDGSTNVYAPGIEVHDTDRGPYSLLLAIAGFVAAIFATVVGTCLASENCGHLEVAWTRPASRLSYAARLMLVDVAAILAVFVFTALLSLALIFARGWQGYMYMDTRFWQVAATEIAFPLAWFGLIAGLTASVRARAGAIAGFTWVACMFLLVLLSFDLPPVIHGLLNALNYVNPLLYGSYSSTSTEPARHLINMTPAFAIGGLIGIATLGIAAALAQWRRLEA